MPTPKPPAPRITVLMCTWNGGAWLTEQLASLAAQDHRDWALWVSDDGSTDATRAIVGDFARAHRGREVRLVEGPRQGPAANFLSLLCRPELPPGIVALVDQDDVWLPHKLSRAAAALDAAGEGARLYGAQSRHVDRHLRPLGVSRPPQRPTGFRNALVQNAVSGHSAVLSPEALALVREAGRVTVPHHDWWLYQLVTGSGGRAIVDDAAVLLYRQHSGNAMGAHRGVLAWAGRAAMVLGRDYGNWIAANLSALAAAPALTAESRALVEALRSLAPGWGPARLGRFRELGLYRQTATGTALLELAAFLGRV